MWKKKKSNLLFFMSKNWKQNIEQSSGLSQECLVKVWNTSGLSDRCAPFTFTNKVLYIIKMLEIIVDKDGSRKKFCLKVVLTPLSTVKEW